MTFAHTTGVYNVEASLVAWLTGYIAANIPPLLSAVHVNLNAPEQPLAPPEWSIHFLGYGGNEAGMEGKHPGTWRYGIMEVSAWVSRSDDNWRGQMNQMVDVVTKAVVNTHSVIIRDFYTNATTPTATAYRITIDRPEQRMPPVDPNPDIERRRVLVFFQWVERA